MKSLEKLTQWCCEENIIIVGGGPSLDYCSFEIEKLVNENSIFFLLDIISQSFISKYPQSKRLIFSVEWRHHSYLRKLKNEKIAFYCNAGKSNINSLSNEIFQFHFDFDQADNPDSIELKSPGTVAGPALYWALNLALSNKNVKNIFLLGLDFYYINQQMYNKHCYFNYNISYWNNRETSEWLGILKKSSIFYYYNDFIIRTSDEFNRTLENMKLLIENVSGRVNLIDYSPLGLSSKIVKKMVPEKIRIEKIAT